MDYEELTKKDLHGCVVKFHTDLLYYRKLAEQGVKLIPEIYCASRKEFLNDQGYYVQKDTGSMVEVLDSEGVAVIFPKWSIHSYVRTLPSWKWHLIKLLGL